MREAIERVIADMEFRRKEAYRQKVRNEGKRISDWHEGRANELGFVINRLKAVIANETSDTGNGSQRESHVRESSGDVQG